MYITMQCSWFSVDILIISNFIFKMSDELNYTVLQNYNHIIVKDQWSYMLGKNEISRRYVSLSSVQFI